MWAKHYQVCQKCGKTDHRYEAKGLCYVCYFQTKNNIESDYIPRGGWSRLYDSCIECGTDELKHKAKGLCTYCYFKSRD